MPARKPASLINRHETAAERRAREDRESSVRPARGLPVNAPAALKDHKVAQAAYRAAIRMYGELDGEIVTRLDLDHLVNFCLLLQHLSEINHMRKVAYDAWLVLAKEHERLVQEDETEKAVAMAIRVVGAFDAIAKLDTRFERKSALLKQYRESLYLTPRARAGAAPDKKEPPEEPDELEKLLDDVTTYVNGPKE